MDASTFIAKWRHVQLSERSAAQQHFLDLCDLVGHPKPAEKDPKGEFFTFERGVTKRTGKKGWADVWYRDHFAFEYKGKHKDLDAAYDQLLLYRGSLENPPLLVTCDMDRLVIHTNFTGTVEQVHDISLEGLARPESLDKVAWLFHDPPKLKPTVTRETITNKVAGAFARIAQGMRDRGVHSRAVARFLNRLVFCMFAEDVGLLPSDLFSRIIDASGRDPKKLAEFLSGLFATMATGGNFGLDPIPYFNGNLFDDSAVVHPTHEDIARIKEAARLDWSQVDPSIFGTLFERGMDPDKRSQFGAHYTSREDIETLIDPVIMQPLRREWDAVRQTIEPQLADVATDAPALSKSRKRAKRPKGEKTTAGLIHDFLQRLQSVTVLDPACGSGNFLYVALQKLKDLEKEVIVYAQDHGLGSFLPLVGPRQLHGIEASQYAHDLAQMTIWIGFLQWQRSNGYRTFPEPILQRLDTIRHMDAILDLTDPANPREPDWPEVEFIVGNPPFLGTKKLRSELGDAYTDELFRTYGARIPNFSDFCCYWFEIARNQIEAGKTKRAGLLATQGIRGGLNREVLNRINKTGSIFFSVSDRDWIQDGANVHVSFVGFDNGSESNKILDGVSVSAINPNLTSTSDITQAARLRENAKIGFIADVKSGKFDLSFQEALPLLLSPNPHALPNSDVLRPWANGLDVTRRPRDYWIIDFGSTATESESALYELPFARVEKIVKPERSAVKRKRYRELWWLHAEPCAEMRRLLWKYPRYLVTTAVSKHRLFAWMSPEVLPDHQLIAFARDDDYFFGVLHSRPHEVWARSQGTQVRERESGFRYTPTTCFETFPFPDPTDALGAAIADAARNLDALRSGWLNPPEWTREEILEFPGSTSGAWSRYVHDPDSRGIGTVRYPRLRPRSASHARALAERTLTNLYNKPPTWLTLAHRRLDEAVFAAYGWDPSLSDDDLLARLLALNLEREPAKSAGGRATGDESG